MLVLYGGGVEGLLGLSEEMRWACPSEESQHSCRGLNSGLNYSFCDPFGLLFYQVLLFFEQ
jgi:hypothetical protein